MCICSTLYGQSLTWKYYKNGTISKEQELAYERTEGKGPLLKEEADEVISHANGPYKEYNEKVYFIGPFIYVKYGLVKIATNSPNVYPKIKAYSSFKVLDTTDEGCRIEPHGINGEKYFDVFVNGMGKGFHSDRTYGAILVFSDGHSFTYNTAIGGRRTIPLYEWGDEITREEYFKRIVSNSTTHYQTNSIK
jgi:hypothetical protein